jgi:hypothetical protein
LISLALCGRFGFGEYVKLIYGTVSVLVLASSLKRCPRNADHQAGVLQISNEPEEAQRCGRDLLAGFAGFCCRLKPTMLAVGIIVFISAAEISTVIFLSRIKAERSLLMLDYMLTQTRRGGGARRVSGVSILRFY